MLVEKNTDILYVKINAKFIAKPIKVLALKH